MTLRNLVLALLFCTSLNAQNATVTSLYESKIRAWAKTISAFHADQSGVYLFKPGLSGTGSLVKTDPNGKLLFEKDFKTLLGDLQVHSIKYFNNKVLLIAINESKDRSSVFYGVYIDPFTGNVEDKFVEIGRFGPTSAKWTYRYTIVSTNDPGKLAIYAPRYTDYKMVTLSLLIFDKKLTGAKSVTIGDAFSLSSLDIHGIFISRNGNILVHGYKYYTVRKKYFKHVIAYICDPAGKKIADLEEPGSDKIMVDYKFNELSDNEWAIAGSYTNELGGKDRNGVYFLVFDVGNGKIKTSFFSTIAKKDLPYLKTKSKDADDPALSPYHFLELLYDSKTQSAYMIFEESRQESRGSVDRASVTYFTKNLRFVNISMADKKIKWITELPKDQLERVGGFGSDAISIVSDMAGQYAYPFFSSYTAALSADKLIVLVNDVSSNDNITGPGVDANEFINFDKSILYAIIIDLQTGIYQRKEIYNNKESNEVLMPRFAMKKDGVFYIPAQDLKLMKESSYKVVKVVIK